MRIDKVNWITAHNYGKLKWHLFSPSLSWKGESFGPRHCLTKCALENNLLDSNCWSWCHFAKGKLPQTLIPVLASTFGGKFFSGPPCILHFYTFHFTIYVLFKVFLCCLDTFYDCFDHCITFQLYCLSLKFVYTSQSESISMNRIQKAWVSHPHQLVTQKAFTWEKKKSKLD